jgi:alpha-glucosidase
VDVLKYAHGIIENNFPVGVIMIDDNWQEDYGKWQFHPGRFNDPKSMVDSLHHMGFKIMVWICPFISPDYDVYRKLRDEGFLIKEKTTHEPAMIHWWNGVSALLDLTNPRAMTWIKQQLSVLTDSVGIDGFKFDAHDAVFSCTMACSRCRTSKGNSESNCNKNSVHSNYSFIGQSFGN